MNVEMCCSGNDDGSRPLVAVLDSVQIWVGGGRFWILFYSNLGEKNSSVLLLLQSETIPSWCS